MSCRKPESFGLVRISAVTAAFIRR